MNIEFNYNNASNFLFHTFNQRKDKKYHYICAIAAAFINITVNCKKTHHIDLTREDLDVVINRMHKAWKIQLEKDENWFAWAKWLDWVNYTLFYVKEQVRKWRKNVNWKNWKCPNLAKFYNEDEEELLKWIDRGYVVLFWFWVNSEFVRDMIDWKIEKYEDYKNYKWERLKHFTNMWKWLRSKEKYWQEFILDSYAHNLQWYEWMYWNFDIKEWLEDLAFRTKYIFF